MKIIFEIELTYDDEVFPELVKDLNTTDLLLLLHSNLYADGLGQVRVIRAPSQQGVS